MKFFAYGVSIFLTLFTISSFAQTTSMEGGPDKITLLYLLRAGAYEPLMLELKNVTETIQQDKSREEYYWRAFDTFEIADPSIEPKLDEWIRQNPGCADAYAARAGYYMQMGWNIRGYGWAKDVSKEQWKGMREYFQKALTDAIQGLKIDPQNLYCYDVLIEIGMNTAEKGLTREIFEKALTVDPGSLEIWASYMWSLLPRWGGSHAEMQEVIKESSRYLSSNPRLKVLRGFIPFDEGWTLEGKGDYQAAIKDFTRAISFGKWQDFYYHRAFCYYDLDEYQPALVDVERALQLSPQNTDYLCLEADVMMSLGDVGEARSVMKDAVKINPTDGTVRQSVNYVSGKESNGLGHSNRGYQLYKQGNLNEAIKEFTLAISSDPQDYTSYYDRGICYRNLGKFDKAVADFRRTTQLKPDYSTAYENLGWIHMQEGKYAEAVTDNTEAIRANPLASGAYFNRAVCLFHLGKGEDALADLKRACQLGNQDACNRYNEVMGQH